jgi:DNA polymerase-3 subunit alpha
MQNFVHLRVCSSYSLAQGAIKLQALAKLALKHQMPAVAITDHNNLYGSLEFTKECVANGIQPIIAASFSIDANIINTSYGATNTLDTILLYAKDEQGYKNLLKLMALCCTKDSPHHISLGELEQFNQGLIVLTAGCAGTIGRLLLQNKTKEAEEFLVKLKQIFQDRLYIEISRHNLEQEQKIEPHFIDFAYKHNLPLVATNDVYFADLGMFEAHDALLCIADGKYIAQDDRKKVTKEHYFKSAQQMQALFADLPEAITNTVIIAKRCSFKPKERAPMLPRFNASIEEEALTLRNSASAGLEVLFANEILVNQTNQQEIREKYQARLAYELDVIISMNFPGYFLIVSDFIKWSKKNNVPVGPGRGSGVGSLVAWSLEITNLDPIKFGLLFERFLNPERISMPDFDIDFCQEKRDLVIEYVKNKYGYDQVANIITFGKLQAKAVIRDVGRVMQLPYGQINRISKMVPFNAVNPINLSQAIEMEPELRKARDDDEQIAKLLDIALQLEGLHRHASTHAAGVVIAGSKLEELVPVCRDANSNMLVVQYSMKYAEAAGLVKFDFLGLKTLTTIDHTNALIKASGVELNFAKIKLDDKNTFKLLARGESIGVFQFESVGMRDTLRKMRPDCIEDLIALGSLYRPGPMENIPTYIACKHGLEKPNYLHHTLEPILKETFGVIIYQEQVMEIAKVLAGYTLGGADLLRRAMGKKIKSEMDAQRELFVTGAVKNQVEEKQASEIFDLVAKFAGYGFNKSHAAAYAMISYQTAYLKANYLIEFLVASINLDINDTDKINIFIQEAKKNKIPILPPDINKSNAYFKIEITHEKCIRYALGAIKNVGIQSILQLEKYRNTKGEFRDIFDFAAKVDSKILNKKQLEKLIKAGVFDQLHPNRAQLFNSIELLVKYNNSTLQEKASKQMSLFKNKLHTINNIKLAETPDWNSDEKLQYEEEAIGFYLNTHPLEKYKEYFNVLGIKDSSVLSNLAIGNHHLKLGAVAIASKIRISAKGRFMAITCSDLTSNFEVTIFDDKIMAQSQDLLEQKAPIIIILEVKKDEGGTRLTANNITSILGAMEKKFHNLKISIENQHVINDLASMAASNKALSLNITIMEENKEVLLQIPKNYKINAQEALLLKSRYPELNMVLS